MRISRCHFSSLLTLNLGHNGLMCVWKSCYHYSIGTPRASRKKHTSFQKSLGITVFCNSGPWSRTGVKSGDFDKFSSKPYFYCSAVNQGLPCKDLLDVLDLPLFPFGFVMWYIVIVIKSILADGESGNIGLTSTKLWINGNSCYKNPTLFKS